MDGLRRAGALALSGVAVLEGRVVGHVGFSPITIHGEGSVSSALALAPVAVHPDFQRRGIGSSLIRWLLEECLRMGHTVVIVLGEPGYSGRFGFRPAATFGIECPFPAPPEAFMAMQLVSGAAASCQGTVRYRPEFDAV